MIVVQSIGLDLSTLLDKFGKLVQEVLEYNGFKVLESRVITNANAPIIIINAYRFSDKLLIEGETKIAVDRNYTLNSPINYSLRIAFNCPEKTSATPSATPSASPPKTNENIFTRAMKRIFPKKYNLIPNNEFSTL